MAIAPTKPSLNPEVRSPAATSSPRGPATPLLHSSDLFGKTREIMIEHAGGYYRLRLTHSNKLILTK